MKFRGSTRVGLAVASVPVVPLLLEPEEFAIVPNPEIDPNAREGRSRLG